MDIYVPLGIILSILCLSTSRSPKDSKITLVIAFVAIFIFLAIRYEFGPDWFMYREIFEQLQAYGPATLVMEKDHCEPLFLYYFSIYSRYTVFLAVNSLLWLTTYYFFIKRYVNYKYYWLTIVFLFFNADCILNNTVAMRQALVGILFILSYYCLCKGKRILFVVIIIIGSFIHTSCLALLPFVFINSSEPTILSSKKYIVVIAILSFISVVVDRYFIMNMIAGYLTSTIDSFSRYSEYLNDTINSGSGTLAILKLAINKILLLIPFISICKLSSYESNKELLIIEKFAIIALTMNLVLGGGLTARFSMMLNIFVIVSLMRLYIKPSKLMATQSILCFLFLSVYSFYFYLQADYCVSFLEYQSIFDAPKIP